MKTKKLLTMLVITTLALIAGCREDNFTEVVGVCPVVVSTDPANNATLVPLNKVITVTFNENMNPATFSPASFSFTGTTAAKINADQSEKSGKSIKSNSLAKDESVVVDLEAAAAITGTIVVSGKTATFTPTGGLTANTTYVGRIKTTVKDLTGNALQADHVWTFSTGIIVLPTVITTDPANLETGVALNKLVSATFSVPMDPATLTATTYTLSNGGTPVAGSISYTGSTVTYTPASDLLPGTVYTATITTGAKNTLGTSLASNKVWTFTTGAAPTVLSTDPLNLATNVFLNKLISVTFSVPMDPLTITTTSFTVKDGATVVAGSIIYTGSTATFTPAAALSPATLYTGTIINSVKNMNGFAMTSNYVWTFTTGTMPTVISVDPLNLSTGVALNKVVTATFSAPMDPLTLTTSTFTVKAGATVVNGAVSYSGSTASFTPAGGLLPGTLYTATITTGAKNVPGLPMPSDFVWTFTTDLSPTVLSTDPLNLATSVAKDKTVTATFSVPMDPLTITASNFTLKDGATTITGLLTYSGSTLTFNPTSDLDAGTVYTGTITTGAKNLAGTSLANNYVWSFTTVAAVIPTVLAVNPLNLATSVALNQTVTATFSTPMDPLTVTASNFTLKDGANTVAGALTYSGSVLTFNPTADLDANTVYTGTITTGVKNLEGTPLANNFVWSFTTIAPVIPTVLATVPIDLATSVALNQTVTATFSTPMDPLTITASNFTLKDGANTVAGALTYSGSVLTFNPTADLDANTVYTGTITTGVKNLDGTPLANNFVWSFTTVAAIIPTVTLTDPLNLATSVALNKTVTATFSTPMDPLTITGTTFTLKDGLVTVAGLLTYSGSTLTFNPTSDLDPNTVYTGTVTTGAKNLAGTPLANNFVWTFTTVAGLAPTVTLTDPLNLATSVVLNKTVTATFSTPMDPLTITGTTFTLKDGAVNVAGLLNYSGSTLTFNPTSDLDANTVYTGTVTTGAKDLAGTSLANNFVWTFTTEAGLAPTVTVTDPLNLATNVVVNKTVTATFSTPMDPLTITGTTFTLKDGAVNVAGLLTYSGSTLTFNPTSDLDLNTVYTGTVTTGAKNLAGTALANNFVWTFTTEAGLAPTVTVTDPLNLATNVVVNKTVTATFSTPMDPLTITGTTFTLKDGLVNVAGLLTYSGSTLTFNPTSDLDLNTVYTGTVTTGAKNLAGTSLANNFVWSFTTEAGLAPTVTVTDPLNLATNVVVNKTVTATFSTPMDPLTITGTTFTLKDGVVNVAGLLTYSGSTLTFNPTSDLDLNTVYTGTVTTGAKNLAGTALANNFVWSFTTEAGLAPTVTLTDPLNLATSVALNKTVTATFSTPMDPLTITGTTFTLKDGAVTVAGLLNYSGSTLTFNPTSNLDPNTVYTGTVTTGAKNLAGTALANNFVWSFTTVSPVAPTVTLTDPLNLATNVVLNKTVTATFSTPMDPLTITGTTFTLKDGAVTVAGLLSYSGSTLTFNPTSNLDPNTVYTGTVTTGAKDLAGTALANNFVWSFTTVNPPTVISTDPLDLALNVPLDQNITATFSVPMDPLTITNLTFTLKDGATTVPGALSYLGSTLTFNPSGFLDNSVTYTATITTGAENTDGVPLENNYIWSFTTAPRLGPVVGNLLGSSADFEAIGKAGISNTGVTSITGDIGVSPGAATLLTGFGLIMDASNTFSTTPIVVGKVYAADYAAPTPAKMTAAVNDMESALVTAMGLTTSVINELGSGNISGMTLVPGLYKWSTGLLITSEGVTLTGGPNDTWVFQISSDFTVDNGAIITLAGGAQAKNIYWVTDTQALLGSTVQFKGNIVAQTLISVNTGGTVLGRCLSQTAVTLNAATLIKP